MRRYYNPHHQKESYPTFLKFLAWQCGFYKDPISYAPPPAGFSFPNSYEPTSLTDRKVTWVNHSTFYIEAFGSCFLTDPIWSTYCSPIPFLGPKRQHVPKPNLETLEKVDYVLISHDHYDHLDKRTVRRLHAMFPSICWIVPWGVKKKMIKFLDVSAHIEELKWGESYQAGPLTITAVAAQHFSGRSFSNRNQTLWMGIVVECEKKERFYFAGDTGYNNSDFKRIGATFGKMDLSLIPIGCYAPREFMKPIHINPDESLAIHQDTHSILSVAGHWKTFKLSDEELDRPPFDLYCALEKAEIPFTQFRVLDPGQTIAW